MNQFDPLMAVLQARPMPDQGRRDATEGDLARLEHEIGHQLQADYREFLLHYGAHRFEHSCRVRMAHGHPYGDELVRLPGFFGFTAGSGWDILQQFHDSRHCDDPVPPELLAIGHDESGNLICLAMTGPQAGKILFWHRETSPVAPDPPDYSNVYLIANSFAEFLQLLETEESSTLFMATVSTLSQAKALFLQELGWHDTGYWLTTPNLLIDFNQPIGQEQANVEKYAHFRPDVYVKLRRRISTSIDSEQGVRDLAKALLFLCMSIATQAIYVGSPSGLRMTWADGKLTIIRPTAFPVPFEVFLSEITIPYTLEEAASGVSQ